MVPRSLFSSTIARFAHHGYHGETVARRLEVAGRLTRKGGLEVARRLARKGGFEVACRLARKGGLGIARTAEVTESDVRGGPPAGDLLDRGSSAGTSAEEKKTWETLGSRKTNCDYLQDDDEGLDDLASSTASLSSSVMHYRTVQGRTYHSSRGNAEYW